MIYTIVAPHHDILGEALEDSMQHWQRLCLCLLLFSVCALLVSSGGLALIIVLKDSFLHLEFFLGRVDLLDPMVAIHESIHDQAESIRSFPWVFLFLTGTTFLGAGVFKLSRTFKD